MKTRIGKHTVPVSPGTTVAFFTSGKRGRHEKGHYFFWTAVCAKGRAGSGQFRLIYARALAHLSAGERFRRIGKERRTADTPEARKANRRHWKKLERVLYVRPSRPVEVGHWLANHPDDAKFLRRVEFQVVRT